MSNQRPRITFTYDGVCSACLFFEYKKTEVNWDKRKKELEDLCDKYRSKTGSWDVIIPGSGGKDSGYVSWKLKKEYGMHPLTVTWAPILPTEIGRKNLESLIDSGFDNILGTPDGEVNRKLSRLTFHKFGDHLLPFIYGMINFPLQIALRYKIPLIFFGEDGEAEYGGSLERGNEPRLDMKYTIKSKFTSLSPQYWKSHGIQSHQLNPYTPPRIQELNKNRIDAHYFSYYENWSPERNYKIARKVVGFSPDPQGRSEGTFIDYAGLDDKTNSFHYYMGLIKFGIGRATADASRQIREGHITRDEGVHFVREYDDEFPSRYYKEFLDYLGINKNEFNKIVDRFRSSIIWKKQNTKWILRNQVS